MTPFAGIATARRVAKSTLLPFREDAEPRIVSSEIIADAGPLICSALFWSIPFASVDAVSVVPADHVLFESIKSAMVPLMRLVYYAVRSRMVRDDVSRAAALIGRIYVAIDAADNLSPLLFGADTEAGLDLVSDAV